VSGSALPDLGSSPPSALTGQNRTYFSQPRLVHVLYFDAEVHCHETYQAGQPIHLTPVGGGGTDFRPCFRWLEEKGITQNDVFLTNLWGTFPDSPPRFPVIWASTDARSRALRSIRPDGKGQAQGFGN
jgi:predicted metal-dependent peptidase